MLLLSANISAQGYINASDDSIAPRFYVNTGLFLPNLTTSLRIASQGALGSKLSIEDDFNFDRTTTVYYVQALMWVKQRSQFVFAYTTIKRTAGLKLA